MEIRCLHGHFLAEMQEGETFLLRIPCVRCKCNYLCKRVDNRLIIRQAEPMPLRVLQRIKTPPAEKKP